MRDEAAEEEYIRLTTGASVSQASQIALEIAVEQRDEGEPPGGGILAEGEERPENE
jgi:hypothetical protein